MSRERDFVFNLARLGRERRAHHDCPVCRGRDLASEVSRWRTAALQYAAMLARLGHKVTLPDVPVQN